MSRLDEILARHNKPIDYVGLVDTIGDKYPDVSKEVVSSLVERESSGRPLVMVDTETRHGYARGVGQFIDETAKRFIPDWQGPEDSLDPEKSIEGIYRYLSHLQKRTGSTERALQLYLGSGEADKFGTRPEDYAKDILNKAGHSGSAPQRESRSALDDVLSRHADLLADTPTESGTALDDVLARHGMGGTVPAPESAQPELPEGMEMRPLVPYDPEKFQAVQPKEHEFRAPDFDKQILESGAQPPMKPEPPTPKTNFFRTSALALMSSIARVPPAIMRWAADDLKKAQEMHRAGDVGAPSVPSASDAYSSLKQRDPQKDFEKKKAFLEKSNIPKEDHEKIIKDLDATIHLLTKAADDVDATVPDWVKAEVAEAQKGTLNPFKSGGLTTWAVSIADQTGLWLSNIAGPGAGGGVAIASMREEFKNNAEQHGLTEDDIAPYVDDVALQAGALEYAGEVATLGLAKRIPGVRRLAKPLYNFLGETVIGKLANTGISAATEGLTEYSQQAIFNHYLGRIARDKMLAEGVPEDALEQKLRREYRNTPLFRSRDFWIGAGIGGGMTGMRTGAQTLAQKASERVDARARQALEQRPEPVPVSQTPVTGETATLEPPTAPAIEGVPLPQGEEQQVIEPDMNAPVEGEQQVIEPDMEAPVEEEPQGFPAEAVEALTGRKPAVVAPSTSPDRRTSDRPREDRRKNIEKRKAIDEMSHEEALEALRYDELTGMKTLRAWNDAEKEPVQVMIDADSLKWINDVMGHESGDKLLQALGSALKESGLDVYRIGGDEIRLQGTDKITIDKALENAYTILGGKTLVAKDPDGNTHTFTGLGFSYGLAENADFDIAKREADQRLADNKKQREAEGKRAPRGEKPPGVVTEFAAGKQDSGHLLDQETDAVVEELTKPRTPEDTRKLLDTMFGGISDERFEELYFDNAEFTDETERENFELSVAFQADLEYAITTNDVYDVKGLVAALQDERRRIRDTAGTVTPAAPVGAATVSPQLEPTETETSAEPEPAPPETEEQAPTPEEAPKPKEVSKPKEAPKPKKESKPPKPTPPLGYAAQIVTSDTHGPAKDRLKFTPEYEQLSKSEKYKKLTEEKRLIRAEIAVYKELHKNTGRLERIYRKLTAEQKKHTDAKKIRARQQKLQLDKYELTATATTADMEEVHKGVVDFLTSEAVTNAPAMLRNFFKRKYSLKEIRSGINSVIKGRIGNPVAQELRREIGGYIQSGMTPPDIIEMISHTPQEGDVGFTDDLPKRKRGLFNERGGTGKESKRLEPEPTSNSVAMQVQKKLDAQDEAVRKKFMPGMRIRLRDITDFLGRVLINVNYYARRMLSKTAEGMAAIEELVATRGSSAEAKAQYEEFIEKITENLPHELEPMLNRYIELLRIIEVEQLKGEDILSTANINTAEAEAYIAEMKQQLSPQEFAAIDRAAKLYHRALNSQLKQLAVEGIITKDLYTKLTEEQVHYSPRVFLQHIDPSHSGFDKKGRKISVTESGIQRLEEGSENAMINNFRLLLADSVSRTQSRIFRNRASRALITYAEAHPDNEAGVKIEEPIGREVSIEDAFGIAENLLGLKTKLEQRMKEPLSQSRRASLERTLAALDQKIYDLNNEKNITDVDTDIEITELQKRALDLTREMRISKSDREFQYYQEKIDRLNDRIAKLSKYPKSAKIMDAIAKAERQIENYQNKIDEPLTGAQIDALQKKIDAVTEKIDNWAVLIDTAQKAGDETIRLNSKTYKPIPQGFQRISAMVDGERKSVLTPDKFADAWISAEPAMDKVLANTIRILSGSFIVRPLATGFLAPEFALTNIPRDAALAWIATKEYSRAVPVALFQMGKNYTKVFADAWTGKGRYRDYIREGGGMEFLNEQGRILAGDPTQMMTPTNERAQQIWNALNKLQEFSERLGRLALREQALANGKTAKEATMIARQYLDFSQGGSWVKAIDNAVPYLNAATQGTRSVVGAFKTDWKTATLKATQLMLMGAGLAAMARHRDDETQEKISDREKVSRWNFPLPLEYVDQRGETRKMYFSIPKDQGQRIFSTIGEVMMERAMGVIDGERAWRRIGMALSDLSPIDAMGLLPPTLKAVIGYALNKDMWTREDAWKGREVSPHKEFYQGHTSQALVDMAEKLSKIGIEVSPVKLEAAGRQVIPQNPLSALLGMGYEQVMGTVSAEARQKVDKEVIQRLSEMPGIRKYLRQTWPTGLRNDDLTKKVLKYDIEEFDSRGRKKSTPRLNVEVKKAMRKENDLKQKHDARLQAISKMLLLDVYGAHEELDKILTEAHVALGYEEKKRLRRRLKEIMAKEQGK